MSSRPRRWPLVLAATAVAVAAAAMAIQRMEDRVDRREAALIAQFARLETSMSQLSGLAAQLAAALPGLSA